MSQPFAKRRKNKRHSNSPLGPIRGKKDLFGLLGRRLAYEALEDRRMLTTDNWINMDSDGGGVFGNGGWNGGANWSEMHAPQNGEDVTILQPTATIVYSSVSGTTSIASLAVGLGSTLDVTGGTLIVTGEANIDGFLIVDGGSVELEGASGISGLEIISGSLTIGSGATATVTDELAQDSDPGDGQWSGGTISIASEATLTLDSGAPVGSPTNWSGTTIEGPGAFDIQSGATLQMSGSGQKLLYDGVTLNNSGTIDEDGTSATNDWVFESGAVLNNLSGGIIDMTTSESIDNANSGNAINNETGALFDNTGPGTSTGSLPFNNQGGTVEVDSGTLSLSGGGTDTGGTFNVASGATLDLTGGSSPALTGTYTGGGVADLGQGTVSLASGSLNIGSAGTTFNFPTGLFNWSGGTIAGNGNPSTPAVLANTGTITLTGTGAKVLYDGLTLNNSGTINEDGTSGTNNWEFETSAVLNNLSGGIVDMTTSEFIDNANSGNAINNEAGATFENTGSNTVSTGSLPFNNQGGIVAATAGTLNLTGGGTDTGGFYNPSTGATINLANGGTAPTLTGTYTGSGGGTVGLPAGAILISSAGATFNFPAGMFNWSGGDIDGNGSPSTPAVLTNTGTITLTGGTAKVLYDGLTLNNSGTINEDGTSGTNNWEFETRATLNNLSGGIVDMTTSEFIDNANSGNAINNEAGATFENTGSNTVSTGSLPFNNQAGATVAATAGTLNLTGGGTDTGGTFNVAGGATINLANGGAAPTLTGTYIGSGGGTVGFPAGTIDIGGTQLSPTVFDFPAGMFNWSGGFIEGNGSPSTPAVLINTGTITLTGSGAKVLYDGLALYNSGTINEDGTSGTDDWEFETSATLGNLSGGVVDMTTTESIDNANSGNLINNEAGATFENTGPGTSTGSLPVNNLGTVLTSSGTLSLGSVIQVSSGTLTAGTWNATGTGKLTLPGGNLTENEGSITLSGTGSFPQIDALNDNVGSLSLLGGDSLTVVPTGGNLASPGSITVGPASTLAVTGAAALSAPSTLNVQVGGTPLSGQFGQLSVSGAATMAGTLNVSLAAGYSPVVGQTYQIVSSPTLSGSFSTINVPTDVSSNPVFSVSTNMTNVTLNALVTATAVVPTGNPAIYTAGGPAVTVDPGVTAAASNPNLTGATVTINNPQSGDNLSFTSPAGSGITGNFAGGVLTLSGTATVSQYTAALQSVTFSSTGTSTVTRNLSIIAVDNSVDTIAAPETVIVDAPITITAAYVAGSAWASSFDAYLASHTNAVTGQPYGSATLGYALQTGSSAAQTETLPWTNVNTITVTFSGPVSGIGLGSLKLNGGSGGSTPTVTGIAQDTGNTYSWTLSGPLTNNRYVIGLASTASSFGPAVVDSRGAGISGTFTTGQAFPSGNGLAGSTFDFFFDVLPGDTNRDAQDTSTDINNIRPLSSGTRTTASSYNPYYDLLGAGQITATTLNTVRALTGRLESANPTAPSDSQQVGTTGFTALALGVQETGSSASSSSATAASNVVLSSTASGTTSIVTTSSGSGGTSSTSGNRDHGRHSLAASETFAATDEAIADFDLADLYV